MKLSRILRGCIVAATCTGFLTAQLAQAAGPQISIRAQPSSAAPQLRVQDVALQEQGVLVGTVLDEQGAPRPATELTVARDGKIVAHARTDASGRFTIAGLTGGVYEVQTAAGSSVFRLWAPHTAPPAAQAVATVLPNASVVRAQFGDGGILGWLANPWVLAGIVAAAIAIPLALDDDDAS